jgi:hypothetical protein
MPPPNDAQPYLGSLPANTRIEAHVAAFSTTLQRVTVIVPGIGEHVFEGQADVDDNPWGTSKIIGSPFQFTTPNTQIQAECWNEQIFGDIPYNYQFLTWEGNPNLFVIPFSMRGAGTLLYFAVDPTPPPQQPSSPPRSPVREHIMWMWNGRGACLKPECVFYVVEAKFGVQFQNGSFGPLIGFTFRGFKSPHDCVTSAQDELRQGHQGMAIAWLQAGQLHNPDAQRVIAANADEALRIISGLQDRGIMLR